MGLGVLRVRLNAGTGNKDVEGEEGADIRAWAQHFFEGTLLTESSLGVIDPFLSLLLFLVFTALYSELLTSSHMPTVQR